MNRVTHQPGDNYITVHIMTLVKVFITDKITLFREVQFLDTIDVLFNNNEIFIVSLELENH